MNDDKWDDNHLVNIAYEIEVIEKVKHPKLMKIFGFWKDEKNKMNLILELAEGGNLHDFLHKSK